MVVRLKDLRSGKKTEEEEKKKSSVVRLSDVRTETPINPMSRESSRLRAESIVQPIDFESAIARLPKEDPFVTNFKSSADRLVNENKKVIRLAGKEFPVADNSKHPSRDIPVIGSILKGLDKVSNFTLPFSKLAGELYTPGGGLANAATLTSNVGSKLAQHAPQLTNTLGGRIATEAIKEGVTGVPLAMGQSLTQGQDMGDVAKQGLIGGIAGGVLGGALPLVGAGAKRLLDSRGNKPVRLADLQNVAPTVDTPSVAPVMDIPITQPTVAPKVTRLADLRAETPVAPVAKVDDIPKGVFPTRPESVSVIPISYKKQVETEITKNVTDEGQVYTIKSKDGNSTIEAVMLNEESVKEAGEFFSELAGQLGITVARTEETARRQGLYTDLMQQLAKQALKENPDIKYVIGSVTSKEALAARKRFPSTKITPFPDDPESFLVRTDIAEIIKGVSKQSDINDIIKTKERRFAETLKESDKTPQGFKERLKTMYTPQSNEETLAMANKRINQDVEEATSYVLSNERYTAEKAATAQRLIDHYNGQGNYQRAVDIAEKVSEEATRAGQGIQALSMFNKLSPEGVLVYAQRKAKKVNEGMPIWSQEKKVTTDMAAQISDLANSTKKMTGITDNSNNVMDILDRAKSGEKLTDADSSALKIFIKDSQQFVKETTRKSPSIKPPTMPKDKRIRDNVVSFLDKQEQAAKERLRAKGIQISSTPLDVWVDMAIIGASKMGKGSIKFADWSEVMVKDLGESIRPQLKQLYERSRETFDNSTKRISQETVSQAEKLTEKVIKGKQLEGPEADSLRSLAQKVSGMSGETKRLASQDLQRVLQSLDNPSLLRKISSTQTIGQLLNPKTQVRNALGNEMFYRMERINKLVATPIDIARSKITGGERTVTFKTNNQGEYWTNWMRGLKAGWKGVNVQGLETQYDLGSPAFKSKLNPMTYLEKALGASLKSFDTAAYMRAYNNTIGEMATLKAINQGKKGDKAFIDNAIRNADDNILKIADEYGRYVTFQDNNLISQGLVKLKRGLNLGKDFGMGDLILKYPKTPGALLMRALEYSPAGFVRSGMILFRPWIKKEPHTAEVMQSLSRAIIGTMGLSGMGYFLMDKGILTGAASKDKDIRELQKSAGQGQYQVNLSALKRFITSDFDPNSAKIQEQDVLYTYDWMQPISMAISIGANTAKNMSEGDNKLSGLAGTAYNSLEGGLGTLTEQSVLQGLKQAAEGYPGQTVTDKIMDILSDIPSSFVPTLSNQIKQLDDNARRETYDPSKLQQSLNRARAKIPGLAGKLPQQYDTLGRPKETYQDNNVFNVMFNPGFASRYKLSPEAKLIVGLIDETGDETLAPRAPSKSITIDGVSVKLTTEEYARMQQYQGEETRKRLEKINPNASLKGKIKRVEDALDKGGSKARDRLRGEMK